MFYDEDYHRYPETESYRKNWEHPNVDVFYRNSYDYRYDETYHDINVKVHFDDVEYKITEGGSDTYYDGMLKYVFEKVIESDGMGDNLYIPVKVTKGEDSPEKRAKLVDVMKDFGEKYLELDTEKPKRVSVDKNKVDFEDENQASNEFDM